MKKNSAFTLIETLIAISVFCIGILTVLFWVSKTLRNQDYANTQIDSAFLAREWIELMFNLRDANYHKELPWNCVFTPVEALKSEYEENVNPYCNSLFEPWEILKISIGSGIEYINIESTKTWIKDFTWMFEEYQIYFHTGDVLNWDTGFVYNHISSEWKETWFARYLIITGVIDENGKEIDPNKLLKIESHVLYKKWELTWEKVMETFIWNYEF